MPDPEEEEEIRLANKNIQTSQGSKLGRYQITSSSGAKHTVVTKPNQSGTGFVVTKDGAFVGYASKGGSPQEQKLQQQIDKGVSLKGSHDYERPDLAKIKTTVDRANNDEDVLTNIKGQVEDVTEIK